MTRRNFTDGAASRDARGPSVARAQEGAYANETGRPFRDALLAFALPLGWVVPAASRS